MRLLFLEFPKRNLSDYHVTPLPENILNLAQLLVEGRRSSLRVRIRPCNHSIRYCIHRVIPSNEVYIFIKMSEVKKNNDRNYSKKTKKNCSVVLKTSLCRVYFFKVRTEIVTRRQRWHHSQQCFVSKLLLFMIHFYVPVNQLRQKQTNYLNNKS